ncbi:2,3-bisphosphoglycerate-independent phosphoglycerate mutase [Roseicyclus mahoneyensis]|uniref:2,3-bisphosphoglycerate-independent phosphoglycerate mutase n=1 Tax=Roseicyclus mahoneyensis TaxID=164332 RepID=A0A316GQ94_9RHOB|nr:2,3-bisphosphoglycerate-independent phosphoglycerate mutase [Roseicyclus mahoneyensis]PWK61684.1 phosphoglycerate mutase [Roseicyclus mahoneyensis]
MPKDQVPKPVVLCILDGWGIGPTLDDNAPHLAQTPNFDRLMATCPHATLITHGRDVGLPQGQMGNSEVGHTNIGAGRIVAMDLGMIDLSIEDGSFFRAPALVDFIATLKASGGRAHVAGLASPGGVHSHQSHIAAAARALTDAGLEVLIHAITDGRDVAPVSAADQIAALHAGLPAGARIVTICGRYFAMDRDNRWDRVEKAYRVMVAGVGHAQPDAQTAIRGAHAHGTTDEFIEPATIGGYDGMRDGDGLFFVNFRADRAREILAAIGDPDFTGFDRGHGPSLAGMLGMVDYSKSHDRYMTTMFPKQEIVNTLAEWVGKQGLRQFHIAETEKYPHVTFFLNGGKEPPVPGEDRYMAQSPKVATYDLQPEMSASEVTDHLVAAIGAGYDLIVANYANPDMVGHTGDLKAAIRACEAVDAELGRVLVALDHAGGAMIVTADHGNCETMRDPATGGPHTAHTTNPVPVILAGGPEGARLRDGILADLAPTLLRLMGLPQPPEMTGKSLIA